MKYTTAILALAAAATTSAQDISIFPECSLPCILQAVATTSCQATDFACVCKNMDAIKQAATPCVVEKCGIDTALNKVLPATEKFCADVGNTPKPPASSSSSSTLATVTTHTTTSSSSSTIAEEPSPTTTSGGGSSMVTPAPSSTGKGSATSSHSHTASATSSVATGGAAGAVMGSWGMLVLGAVAAL